MKPSLSQSTRYHARLCHTGFRIPQHLGHDGRPHRGAIASVRFGDPRQKKLLGRSHHSSGDRRQTTDRLDNLHAPVCNVL